ncbi:hypothetical protein [Mycolicibacterium vanbaalenii]|uniref:hypothetical protein n=1 Tax=Mycolicibacterium vanbaalenii TaxID=110539 RepID=UPI001F18D10F|nr:hypothetical protein [Mycolicibacterium vanbaalenii]
MLATVTDGKLTKVTGDPDNPMFKGYTCTKGRALPQIHNNPARLLHSQKRQPDGTYAPRRERNGDGRDRGPSAGTDRPARAALGGDVPGHQRPSLSGEPTDGQCVPARDRIADVLHRQHHRPTRQADRRTSRCASAGSWRIPWF